MILAIRHFPDKKKPAIVLEEQHGASALVIGYLTDTKREAWLRKALRAESNIQLAVQLAGTDLLTVDDLLNDREPVMWTN